MVYNSGKNKLFLKFKTKFFFEIIKGIESLPQSQMF